MTALTQKALRVFSVLEDYRNGSSDILEALLPFLEPFLSDVTGKLLDPDSLAIAINQTYRWSLTGDVIEELIPKFVEKGWIEEVPHQTGNNQKAYMVKEFPTLRLSDDEVRVSQLLVNIVEDFSEFIKTLSSLFGFNKSIDELSDILIEWLLSIDGYTEEVLRQQSSAVSQIKGRLGVKTFEVVDTSGLSTEEKYLCARFVKHLIDEQSPHISALCKIASVGLITEVVQDFSKPTTQVAKTDLILYLDAPVALDLIGVSGKAASENIRPIIKQLQSIGVIIRIFRTSVNEAQRALQAVLKRNAPERTGATADAIRRNETLEAYVRQASINLESVLSPYNINVFDRELNQFPGEFKYFSQALYEKLKGYINWHTERTPREHDATVSALITRLRGDYKSSDLFKTKHVLITKNGLFFQTVRKFFIDNGLIQSDQIPAIIHQRQLATAVWLRTGLTSSQSEEFSKRYVLSACERVLEIRKNVVDKVRAEAKSLTAEKAQQLELLLTQDRSTQLLMDKTLGLSSVITDKNISMLVEAMRRSTIEEVVSKTDKDMAEVKKAAKDSVKKARNEKQGIETVLASRTSELLDSQLKQKDTILKTVKDVNKYNSIFHKIIRFFTSILIILLFIGIPIASECIDNFIIKLIVIAVNGLIAGYLTYIQAFDIPLGIKEMTKRLDDWVLMKVASVRGQEKLISEYEIHYSSGVFIIK